MFRIIPVVALLLCLWPAAPAQKATETTPPKPTGDSAAKPADYSKESYLIEQLSTSYRFENDGTGRRELRARVKIQSEAGVERWGQLVFGYNSANERMEIPYVRVQKADGSSVAASADSVQDLSAPVERQAPVYTDFRQKHITVPALQPGEVLEFEVVSIVHTPLAPGQFWMEHNFDKVEIVLDEQVEVSVPRERVVKLKTQPGAEPRIAEENGRSIYRWASSHRDREGEDDKTKQKKKRRKANRKFPPYR